MSRRTATASRAPARPWQQPGFTFLPLDEHGAAIWPPGYVPQAAAGARSNARVEADALAHTHVERQRREATGWAGNTFDKANTPHNQAAPGWLEAKPAALPERQWRVADDAYIWLALQCIDRKRRPITVYELADALGTDRNCARAAMQPWLERQVLRLVEPAVPPLVQRGYKPQRDFALGPNHDAVRVRVYR